jgi:regulator of protease activity HflC (stomatin/prohibitin superfamily)
MINPENFPKTAFIDNLTLINKKTNAEIDGAAERKSKMEAMRFRPDMLYATNEQREGIAAGNYYAFKTDDNSDEYLVNGVWFLRPMDPNKELDITLLKGHPGINIISPSSRTYFQSFLRGINMFIRACSVVFGFSLWASSKQILPGNGQFGYAKDFNGNIEIYPPAPGYRMPVSPWTKIEVARLTDPYVEIKTDVNGQEVGRIHILNVPKGKYACGMKNGSPVFLPYGRHLIDSTEFKLEKDAATKEAKYFSESDEVISYNGSHIIRVPQGYVGHGSIREKTVILEHEYSDFDYQHGTKKGAYVFHDNNFVLGNAPAPEPGARHVGEKHANFQHIGNQIVKLDTVRVLNVPASHAVPTYNGSNLEIYAEGYHALPDALHQEARYAKGTQGKSEQIIDIDCTENPLEFANKYNATSKDDHPIVISATLMFQIVDVDKCVRNKGLMDYQSILTTTALSTLSAVVREMKYSPSSKVEGDVISEELLRSKFLERLKTELGDDSGIKIFSVKFVYDLQKTFKDTLLAQDLKKRDAHVTNEADTAKAQTQRDIATKDAEQKNAAALKAAETAAAVQQTQAKAQATSVITIAQGQVDALKLYEHNDFAKEIKRIEATGAAIPEGAKLFIGNPGQLPVMFSADTAAFSGRVINAEVAGANTASLRSDNGSNSNNSNWK